MAQKLRCPVCKELLINNPDLVVENEVVFDYEKIKKTDKPVSIIKCHNCKRRLKYFVEDL